MTAVSYVDLKKKIAIKKSLLLCELTTDIL